MSKIRKDESTVLVINGTPYSLVRDLDLKAGVVCDKCDLREMCKTTNNRMDLGGLCWPEGLSSAWYFIIDWDIINKHIRDYLDIDLECGRID